MNTSFFKYLITNEPNKTLEERHIFNLFVLLVTTFFYLATIFNYIISLDQVIQTSFAGAVLLSGFYIISRFFIYNSKLVVVFVIVSFISLNALFVANFGYNGPIVYNFITLGMAILFFMKKSERFIFMTLLVVNLGVLALIEYSHPEYFGDYTDFRVRLLDHYANILFSLITLSLLFFLMLQLIESQKQKAEESDRIKSSFLANMSHEIRTPLNGIVGFSSLLTEDNFSKEELQHFVQVIQANSDHLASLINDLIDISIIEANAVDLKYAPLNLNAFMSHLYKKSEALIASRQKNINLILNNGLQNENPILFTDKVRLSQILTNLINNAVNFSESPSIQFGYTLGTTQKYLQFFVKDNGIGISKQEQKLIFKPFSKTNKAKSLSVGGTGIGLSIARSLTELMGGRIWIDSEINKGTAFYFTIPYYKNISDIPIDLI